MPAASQASDNSSMCWPATWSAAAPRATMEAERNRCPVREGIASAPSTGPSGVRRSGPKVSAPPTAITGRTEKKTRCQLQVRLSHAAIVGPMKAGSIQAIDIHVIIRARSRASKTRPMMTITARLSVPPPSPWTNRPATSTIMLCAVPATTIPTAKTMKPTTRGGFGPNRSLACPAATIANVWAIMKAVNAQA